jgi:hypothetical protein
VCNDLKHTREFYEEILRKAKEITEKITHQSDPKKAQRLLEVCNENYSANQQF